MATHSAATTGGNWPRKFTINRRNGQQAKDGKPFFFEWTKELPGDENPNRVFETRTGGDGSKKHYELFASIEGYFESLEKVVPSYAAEKEEHLILKMRDVDEKYEIDLGSIDSRYSMNFMSRILNPNFDASRLIKVSPYAVENKDTGKTNMGVALVCGGEKIDSRRNDTFEGYPEPNTYVVKGLKKYDFSPISDFLWNEYTKAGGKVKNSDVFAQTPEPTVEEVPSKIGDKESKSIKWLESQADVSEGDERAILHAANTVWRKVQEKTLSLQLGAICEATGLNLVDREGVLVVDDLPF
jgi:hypothetical protein